MTFQDRHREKSEEVIQSIQDDVTRSFELEGLGPGQKIGVTFDGR